MPLELIQIDDVALELAESSPIDTISLAFMRESVGTNIAILYLDDCEKVEGQIENQTFIKRLRTIDNILLNDDRDPENPNILRDITAEKRYWAIDWGLAMDRCEVYKDIQTGDINTRMMYYQTCNVVKRPDYLLRKSPGRIPLKSQEIEGIIHEIMEEIPIEWEIYGAREILKEILNIRATSNKIFEARRRQ